MARLDESPSSDSPLFKKKDLQIIKFFKNTSCSFEDYSFPSSSNQKPQTLRACIIDLSPLKDKKQELLNHIKNPSNWSEKYIHPSLFNKYHRYRKTRRFQLDGNKLVIYVPQDALLASILDAAKNTNCLPLSASQIQEDKIPKGSLFNKGCSIRVQNQQLKADGNLHPFYNPHAIDSLFEQKEDLRTFKNRFLDSLKKSPFNFNNPIIYSTRFTLNTEKSDSNKNLNRSEIRNQLKADQKTSRLRQDASSDSAGFEIHIIEVSQDLDKVMKSLILRSALKSCSPLKLSQIDAKKIPENQSFLQACSLRLQDHRLKPGSSLYNFYKQDQAIDNLFKSNFKNQFIIKLKAPDIFKENIKNTIIYSKLSREKSNPIAPDSSQRISPDATQDPLDANPDDRSPDATQSLDDSPSADLWFFEIHIIQTDNLKSLILKENFKDCSVINSNTTLPFSLPSNQLFYRGCQINVKDIPIDFNQNHLYNAFNDSQFKLRLIKKINDHFNLKDQAYPNESILKTSDLKNDGSFDIFIVQTQNKGRQPDIREINQAANELIQDFMNQAEKRQCLPLIHDDLMSININLASQYVAEQACQISLTHENLKRNGLVKKDKIQELIDNSAFKQGFIGKVNLKRKPPFDIDKTEVYHYLKRSDKKLIIILYQVLKIKDPKDIILEDASSSEDLTDSEKQEIERKINLNPQDSLIQVFKIKVQDDQFKPDAPLYDFLEISQIQSILNQDDFKQRLMNQVKTKHKLTRKYRYSLKMGDPDTGSFEIYFYKSPEDLVKEIILAHTSSSTNLSDADKKYIQDQSLFKDIWVKEGFKIKVQDDQFKPDAPLYNFIANQSKLGKIIDTIKAEYKVRGEYSYSLNMLDADTGTFEIYFYKNAAKSLKNMIIADLENCGDLEEGELQALKADDKIYDSKYISNACGILIEDRNLASLIGENKVESFKDTDYKQEIADGLNKANLNLDKHMSVYFKVKDMTKGRIGVILAETKREKKSALIEALEILRNNISSGSKNKKIIEEVYGVQYINLGISLHWNDNRFQSGGEFDKSFALIDEILKDPTQRTAWIASANEYRREFWKIQQAIPNDENTILRSQFNKVFIIDIFTLTESPKESIQSLLLDWIDLTIIEYWDYEFIRSSDDIKDFEAGRSLKKGLKIREILDERLEEGGSLSSYYDNAKEFNPLLDDADFKRKVITKINDYFEDKLFSRDNLENIKIKVQNFRDRKKFELVIYELEPK